MDSKITSRRVRRMSKRELDSHGFTMIDGRNPYWRRTILNTETRYVEERYYSSRGAILTLDTTYEV